MIEAPPDNSDVGKLVVGGRPVRPDGTSLRYSLRFDGNALVSYKIVNETYSLFPGDNEKFEGKLFRRFSDSAFLRHIKNTTYACDAYPGPLQHFQIVSEPIVIDVITTREPSIEIADPAQASRRLAAIGGSEPGFVAPPRRRWF